MSRYRGITVYHYLTLDRLDAPILIDLIRSYRGLVADFLRVYGEQRGITAPRKIEDFRRRIESFPIDAAERLVRDDSNFEPEPLSPDQLAFLKALAAHHARVVERRISKATVEFGEGTVEQLTRQHGALLNWSRWWTEVEPLTIAWPTPYVLRHVQDSNRDLVAPLLAAAEAPGTTGTFFVAMAMHDETTTAGHLDAIRAAIDDLNRACGTNYLAQRVDDRPRADMINHRIEEMIRDAVGVIIDCTEERPSVYFEAGFAKALGKPTFFVARKGTRLHFDVAAYQCEIFETVDQLRERLTRTIRSDFEARGTLPRPS